MAVFTLHKIKEYAEKRGVSIRKLGSMVGLSPSSITEMIRRNRGDVFNVMKIAGELQVPVEEFVTFDSDEAWGINSSLKAIRDVSNKILGNSADSGGYIPLITFDLMQNKTLQELLKSDDLRIKNYILPNVPDSDFIIQMPGKAMVPEILPGDMLICKYLDNCQPIEYGETYLLEIADGQFIVRKIKPDDAESFMLFGADETNYPAFKYPKKNVISLSKVVAKIRLE